MKIVHAYKIYMPDVFGGIPAVIHALTAPSGGHQQEIVVARRRGWTRRYSVDGTCVLAAASLGNLFSMPIAPTYPTALSAHCRTADILFHHMPFPLTDLAIWIALPKSTRLIVYWHADVVGRSIAKMLVSPFVRHALKRADAIVVASEATANASPLLAPYLSKVSVIPYAVDTHYWANLDRDQSIEVGRRQNKHPRLCVTVGRLVHYKGYDILLRAMTQVDTELVIIGEGPLRNELQKLAEKLGISHRVIFTGNIARDEIKVWMHAAGAFVLPSRTIAEAFGIVQIEAMAASLPVINTHLATAVPMIARHELEGLTVQPENAKELAGAIQRLIDDPAYAKLLGAAGRERAVSEYENSVFQGRISTLYEEVARSRAVHAL